MNRPQHLENENLEHFCNICGKQSFSRLELMKHQDKEHEALHKQSVHEGVKYPCRQCDYKATSKGNLTQHKRVVHEGVKYPCRQCDHKATSKGHLDNLDD